MSTLILYTEKYERLLPTLHERGRRLAVAADAIVLGRGGLTLCHRASGLAMSTILRGVEELEKPVVLVPERSRGTGGGRKKLIEKDPTLLSDLQELAEAHALGDPESPLQWTSASTRTLARELQARGHRVQHNVVAILLKASDYTLQAPAKTREGTNHPDRDAQFRHINAEVKRFQTSVDPVISIDTKKKENVGNFKNNGVQWLPKGKPLEVNMHDFPDPTRGKAVPYGIYDYLQKDGYVNVGINHDTGEFSVASIERWWEHVGKSRYPHAKRLLVTADAGGSNGYRLRLWKKELQRFADTARLSITVCHYPPGTSKWNKIEHKLFSFISMNWKGKVLSSYETIVNLIAGTTTQSGLKIYAALDERVYELKKRVSDAEMRALNLRPHEFHGEWNYTLIPRHVSV